MASKPDEGGSNEMGEHDPAASSSVEFVHKEEQHIGVRENEETEEIDPVIEKQLLRKLDLRVMTLLFSLYMLSFLDRTNIGNARIAGMEQDLQLKGRQYTWLVTIFYIAYITFQFQAMIWKVIAPHIWATIVVLSWGVIATCQGAVQSWSGEMVLRFLLGAAEAGFGPGIPYLLSFFYRRHELGLRCALVLAAAPIANTFSGALAYGITSKKYEIASWRVLFLAEGLPTILMAPVVYFFLPDNPSSARFLSEEEKKVARTRAVRQVGRVERVGGLNWREAFATCFDSTAWFGTLMYFSCLVSFASLPVFLPTIIRDMGFTAVNAQGLTAPPFFVAALFTIGTTWLSDRLQQRGITVAISSFVAASGFILLATCERVAARYTGVWIASSGLFSAMANIAPWLINNQGSDTRRGAVSVIMNLLGQCGTILGTNMFPNSDRPRYIKGQTVCAAFMLFNGILALGLRLVLDRKNRKLDEKCRGVAECREERLAHRGQVASEDYGPAFRYIL